MYENEYHVYILANQRYGTLYTGVTGQLVQRLDEHKAGVVKGFTKKYGIKDLVYYETHTDIYEAIIREKLIKRWRRKWKIQLIESQNPLWKDLSNTL